MELVYPTAILEATILKEYAEAERFKWGAYDEEEYQDLGDYALGQQEFEDDAIEDC